MLCARTPTWACDAGSQYCSSARVPRCAGRGFCHTYQNMPYSALQYVSRKAGWTGLCSRCLTIPDVCLQGWPLSAPPTYIFPFVKEPGLLPKKGDFIALLLLSIRSDHAPQANIVISCEGNQGRFCRRIHLARCSSPDQTARAHCSSQVAPPACLHRWMREENNPWSLSRVVASRPRRPAGTNGIKRVRANRQSCVANSAATLTFVCSGPESVLAVCY